MKLSSKAYCHKIAILYLHKDIGNMWLSHRPRHDIIYHKNASKFMKSQVYNARFYTRILPGACAYEYQYSIHIHALVLVFYMQCDSEKSALSHYRWSPHNRSPRTKCGSHGWSPRTMHGCYTWSRGDHLRHVASPQLVPLNYRRSPTAV